MQRDIVTSPELALADYLAQNAVAVLLSVTLVWLLITAAFWHVVHTYGATLWSLAVRTWRWWQECAFARGLARVPFIGPLFVRSITVLRYLGLHAVVSFTIAVLATTAFVELGDEIGIGESLAAFDAALAGALDRHVSPATLRVFAAITLLGDGAVLVPLAIGVTLVLAFSRRWMLTAAWAVATAGGGLLNLLLKQIFARARPPHAHGWVTETSYSFPSGHASGSMVIYGLLAYLIVRYAAPRWHVPVTRRWSR